MKIAIYTRGGEYISDEELRGWLEIAKDGLSEVCFNEAYAAQVRTKGFDVASYSSAPQLRDGILMMLSYGGDGTLLECVGMLAGLDIPVMGVNSGRLGFLSNMVREEPRLLLEKIKNGKYVVDRRSVIEAEGRGMALNEFTIQKEGLNMINIAIKINGEDAADYQTDGLIISTPTGSTAYSMSLGGPIVAPTCDCILITPIAPHNLTIRPLVVEGDSVIEVSGRSRTGRMIATLDNESYDMTDGERFILRRKSDRVRIAFPEGSTFYSTIRNKLMWGIDSRKK